MFFGKADARKKDTGGSGGVNMDDLRRIFDGCGDFSVTEAAVGGSGQRVYLCYIDGLVRAEAVDRDVFAPLTDPVRFRGCFTDGDRLGRVLSGSVCCTPAAEKSSPEELAAALLQGFCAVVFDAQSAAVAFEVKTDDKRAVTEPAAEKAVKGAKDAFTETLRTNTSLVRRKLRDARLKTAETGTGRLSHTKISVLYFQGVADPGTVEQVRRRVESIDADAVLSASVIEEALSDPRRTVFPLVMSTERADRFSMSIAQGRVGVLADGLPLGFVVPVTLAQTLSAPEDRAQHFAVSAAVRAIRYLALLLTVLLPAVYVAVVMFHQEMLPTKLMLSIIESKRNVPFSTAAEVTAMLAAVELLQEAGLRLPEPVGQTVSIIGALIVGQSAVEAKVVSPVVVIVVAISVVSGYAMPNQDLSAALRLWRFFFALAAMINGMFALACAGVILIYHLSSLESYGVPYLSPFTDGGAREKLRALFRLPEKGSRR